MDTREELIREIVRLLETSDRETLIFILAFLLG
jgi:hypothetical protein